VSDGTSQGTKVENAKTGEVLDNVVAIEVKASVDDPVCRARIELIDVPVDMQVEAENLAPIVPEGMRTEP
jgi:hypothetical protein